MKKFISFLLMVSLFVFVFAVMAVPSFAADKIVIKIATGTASDHPENVGCRYFEKLVEERTDGKVDVQLYDQGQLGAHKDYLEGLRMGTIEITMVGIGELSAYEPILGLFDLPYLYDSPDQAYRAVEGPLFEKLKGLTDKHDFKILAFWEAGTRHITNNVRPINTPEDLKGLKIRVPTAKVSVDTFNTFGANASPLAFTELYMALQQGVYDGQENPLSNIYASKFYEVQHYLSLTGHQFLIHVFMYSNKLWDKLPEDIQKVVQEAAKEAALYQRYVVHEEDANLLAVLKEKGMEVNKADADAFREAAKPLYDKYIEEYGSEAKEIIDTIRATK